MSGKTFVEIVAWLLFAAILGFVIAWLVRRLTSRRDHDHSGVTSTAGVGETAGFGAAGAGAAAAATVATSHHGVDRDIDMAFGGDRDPRLDGEAGQDVDVPSAGLAAAAPSVEADVPAVDVDAEVPPVEVPSVDVDPEVPSVEMPSVSGDAAAPPVDVDADVPSVDVAAEVPSVGLDAEAPSVDVPSVGVDGDVDVPSTGLAAAVPSVDVDADVPAVDVDAEVPSVDVPSVGVAAAAPSVEADVPSVDVDGAAPSGAGNAGVAPVGLASAVAPSAVGGAAVDDEVVADEEVPAAAAAGSSKLQPLVSHPSAGLPLADSSAPGPEWTIKGNADSGLYHTPDSPYYGRTKAEAWFRTEADARAAGFLPHGSGAEATPQVPVMEGYQFAAAALADGSAPGAEWTIKGNADSGLYHTPASPYYGRTKAEAWFRTEAEAEADGFTKYR